MTLVAMRVQGVYNALKRQPLRLLFGAGLLALVYWGVGSLTERALRFLSEMPDIGTIADAVVLRSLEGLFVVLMVSVAFSVLTGAISTLFGSTDLALLLSLPVAPWQVFGLKVAETYLSSALLPALFTLPVLTALGAHHGAPLAYYPVAVLAVMALYALPVALGALLALVLMRLAPQGRAKEVATALSVVAAAGLVLGLRALRPEQLNALTPEEFEALLGAFANLQLGWLPSAWASNAVWRALDGAVSAPALALLVLAALSLALVGWVAGRAYAQGWFRGLDSLPAGSAAAAARRRQPGWWERPLERVGQGVVVKDVLLLARDPSQWSQLLVLLALAGVYFISTDSLAVGMQSFRDAIGMLNVAFLAFLLAGVGVRVAFPLVSLEGEGFWLVKTAPLHAARLVRAKFLGALPVMLLFGCGLGFAVALRLELSAAMQVAAPLAGASAAVALTGLGVGLGAAFPRFDSTNPTEISMSAGGLLYMVCALAYAVLSTALFAYPAWRSITGRGAVAFSWTGQEGVLVLAVLALLVGLFAAVPLVIGSRRLEAWEPAQD